MADQPTAAGEDRKTYSDSEAREAMRTILAGSPEEGEDPENEQPSSESEEAVEADELEDAGSEDEAEDEVEETEDEDAEDEDAEESEDGENEEGDDEGDEEDLHTVKVRGEELQVPYDELIRGYSRTEDYTRDKQALAQREEQVVDKYREARDAYAEQLQVAQRLLTQFGPEEHNWEQLRQTDPQKFAEEYGRYQQFQRQVGGIRQQLQAVQMEAQREQQIRRQEFLERERQRLLEAFPDWRDEQKAQEAHGRMADFMKHEYGFDESDLAAVDDHRVFKVIQDAMKYRDLQAKERTVREKGRKARKTLEPGGRAPKGKRASKRKAEQNALERLKETGSEADAFAALKARLS